MEELKNEVSILAESWGVKEQIFVPKEETFQTHAFDDKAKTNSEPYKMKPKKELKINQRFFVKQIFVAPGLQTQ